MYCACILCELNTAWSFTVNFINGQEYVHKCGSQIAYAYYKKNI